MADEVRVQITGTDDATPAFQSGAEAADVYSQKLTSLGDVFESFSARINDNVAAQQAAAAGGNSLGASFDSLADSLAKTNAVAKETAPAVSGVGNEVAKASESAAGFGDKIANFIEHPLQSAGEAAKGFVTAIGPVGIVSLAAGAGLMELGKQAFDLVNEEGAAARGTQNLANMLNLSYEQTKKLGEMARLVDTDIGSLARASFRLAEALDDPTGAGKKEADILQKMGISAKDSGDALLQVLQKLAEMPDKTKRVEEAHILLGRASFQLEPLIENYDRLKKAIEDMGGVVSKEGVESVMEAHEKITQLGIAWDHLKEQMAAKLSGVVEIAVKLVTPTPGGGAEALEDQLTRAKQLVASMASAGYATGGEDIFGISVEDAKAKVAALEKQKATQDDAAAKAKAVTDAAISGAKQWQAANDKTLDGMKEKLETVSAKAKTLAGELGNTIKPLATEDRAATQRDYNAAVKEEAALKLQIKTAERAASGEDAKEAQRQFQEQMKREDEEAKHWWRDYDEKRKAIEKQGDEAAEAALAQIRINELMVADQAKILKKNPMDEIDKWNREAAEKTADAKAKAEISAATSAYEFGKAQAERRLKDHQIDAAQEIKILKDLETAKSEAQQKAAQAEVGGRMDDAGVIEVEAKLAKLQADYKRTMAALDEDAKKALTTMQATTVGAINSIGNAFDRGFAQWAGHGKSFGKAMAQSFREMGASMMENVEKATVKMLEQAAIQKMIGKEQAMSQAYQAAAKAYNAMAGIPYVGPILGAAAAATTFAAVAAFAGSAEKGAQLPATGGPFPMLLHKKERVLTAEETADYNAGTKRGGDTHNHYYTYNAAQGESPGSIMQNKAAFRQMVREAARAWIPAGQGA
jgi:hypothetical protein